MNATIESTLIDVRAVEKCHHMSFSTPELEIPDVTTGGIIQAVDEILQIGQELAADDLVIYPPARATEAPSYGRYSVGKRLYFFRFDGAYFGHIVGRLGIMGDLHDLKRSGTPIMATLESKPAGTFVNIQVTIDGKMPAPTVKVKFVG